MFNLIPLILEVHLKVFLGCCFFARACSMHQPILWLGAPTHKATGTRASQLCTADLGGVHARCQGRLNVNTAELQGIMSHLSRIGMFFTPYPLFRSRLTKYDIAHVDLCAACAPCRCCFSLRKKLMLAYASQGLAYATLILQVRFKK